MQSTQDKIRKLNKLATEYTKEILHEVFGHTDEHQAVIVYDTNSVLSNILATAYQESLPKAKCINFNTTAAEDILATLNALDALDIVILIQSTNFRLDAFRIRVELFKRKIKVLEHPHLSRISDDEMPIYINALKYDTHYIKEIGQALKGKIDSGLNTVIDSNNALLTFPVGLEPAKLNIGDYTPMPNIGGQFPIGEVFTESKELRAVHGRVNIFAFADLSYRVNKPKKPITLIIEEGIVVSCENSTPAFDDMINLIREGEEVVWVRELGFGLNRGMSKVDIVSDIGSYERMCGVHLSLGAKHGMYGKPGFKRGDGKFHIDVFVDTKTVHIDDQLIFKDEGWIV